MSSFSIPCLFSFVLISFLFFSFLLHFLYFFMIIFPFFIQFIWNRDSNVLMLHLFLTCISPSLPCTFFNKIMQDLIVKLNYFYNENFFMWMPKYIFLLISDLDGRRTFTWAFFHWAVLIIWLPQYLSWLTSLWSRHGNDFSKVDSFCSSHTGCSLLCVCVCVCN